MTIALEAAPVSPVPLSQELFASARVAVHAFVEAINSHDPDRIASVMTVDHVFIDASGMRHKGRDTMVQAWREYFGWFPDYEIQIETAFPGPPAGVPFDSVPSYTDQPNIPVSVFGWAMGKASSQYRDLSGLSDPEKFQNPDEPIKVRGRVRPSPKRIWRVPAAWLAIVRGKKIAEWRTFCDLEPIFRSLGHDRWNDE